MRAARGGGGSDKGTESKVGLRNGHMLMKTELSRVAVSDRQGG